MRILALLATALLLTACPAEEPAPASAPAPTADSSGAKGAAKPTAKAAPMIEASAVQTALDGWLAAQNGGDFDAYAGAYADKFFGIKRSGPRTSQYVRAGWLEDRKRMFRKPMVVQADQVKIGTARAAATVTFVQTWSSGTYKDVGPKQLVLVPTAAGLKIAREEMLRSTLLGDSPRAGGDLGFAQVETIDGDLMIHLSESLDEDVATGVLFLASTDPAVVKRIIDASKLGTERAGLVGTKVSLYDGTGRVCDATIADFHGVTRFYAHFGMLDVWNGAAREWDPDLRQPTEVEIAEEIWSMSSPGLWARVTPARDQVCDGALWGRSGALAPPKLWSQDTTMASALKPTVSKALAELPAWKEQQRSFADDGGSGPWTTDLTIKAFTDRASGSTYVAASAADGDGCGAFYGEIWAVWEVTAGGTLTLRTDGASPGPLFFPDSAFDLNGDHVPELFGRDVPWNVPANTLVEFEGGQFRPARSTAMPSFDCPC
ncbi:MAG: nuclear transport factor 2 family protein [Proteobacteria bacterium]|nr:nuclear transport factor 2 family protein [Pseudomonadota bacterium]